MTGWRKRQIMNAQKEKEMNIYTSKEEYLEAELQATNRQVEILSDALAESRRANAELLEALEDALNLIVTVTPLEGDTVRKTRAAIAKHGEKA